MIPRATYRLQFHKGFTFADARPLAPYLARLGISHVYASPIARARAGSAHGYDVVDPTVVNPELGGEAAFRELVAALRAESLGVILDIVPNHMAVGGADNRWWLDVLENGEASRHAQFFDIDWRATDPALQGKVLAPFLGAPYAEALLAGDVRLVQDDRGLAATAYGHHRFPIRPADRDEVLRAGLDSFDPGGADGRQRLHELLERQNFRLAWWRVAGDEINWRRFFDITELAGVRVDRPEVFETLHALPLRLYAEGLIDGLRVDHVDGLADPGGYCRRLRERLRELQARRPGDAPSGPAYLVVEKILARGERLPPDWGCDGTTGYDFMNDVSALLHEPAGETALTGLWAKTSGRPTHFEVEERTARREILTRSFAGQLEATARAFHRLARSDVTTRDLARGAIRRALVALLSVFPAYRTYGAGEALATDAPILERAMVEARGLAGPGDEPAFVQIAAWLSGEGPGDLEDRREALRRFQQLSAPVSAKAVEDTAFYRYGRLLSRNDVGFDPDRFASSLADFHAASAARATSFPAAMLATATHDHKRGEDVRARLAVLSELPDAWTELARAWSERNGAAEARVHPADELQIYQTLVGALPLDLAPDDGERLARFRERVGGWLVKALREAKLRSSWTAPDGGYEEACRGFMDRLLTPGCAPAFQTELFAFVDRIAPAGALNGLAQTLLKCASPGVPDIYQGAEFWDSSLVDPDNRRPVDFHTRRQALAQAAPVGGLLTEWRTGALKQAVIARALRLRRERPGLFADGGYQPLEAEGARAGAVIAFQRRQGDGVALAAAAIRCAPALLGAARPLPPPDWWADTRLVTPPELRGRRLVDRLGGPETEIGDRIAVRDLFGSAPVALLAA